MKLLVLKYIRSLFRGNYISIEMVGNQSIHFKYCHYFFIMLYKMSCPTLLGIFTVNVAPCQYRLSHPLHCCHLEVWPCPNTAWVWSRWAMGLPLVRQSGHDLPVYLSCSELLPSHILLYLLLITLTEPMSRSSARQPRTAHHSATLRLSSSGNCRIVSMIGNALHACWAW